MIVVAIIGILAAIAIPQYADYTQRTKLTGALAAVAGIKTQVALCAQEQGQLTGCTAGTNGIAANIKAADNVSYVKSTLTADGKITLTSEAVTGGAASADMVLILQPTAAAGASTITWAFDVAQNGCRVKTPGRGINCTP